MRPCPALLAILLLAACGDRAPSYELSGRTMGTHYSVKVAQPMPRPQRERLQQEIEAVLQEVENGMSTWLVHSEVSQFNASPSTNWFPVSQSTCRAVEAANGVSRLTDGAFDVTVGPLVNLWGFGPDGVRLDPPPQSEIDAALGRVGYQRLHADCERPALRKDAPDLYVDLSGYAQGLAVDRVARQLESRGIRRYLVEIGGELSLRGLDTDEEPWSVAIETASDTGPPVRRIVSLTDKAVATSGDYRNFFEHEGQRYSHAIDPRTGRPVTHGLASVTVIGDGAALADALATALLVLGPDQGFDLAVRERIPASFQLRTDSGFSERLTPEFIALNSRKP
jgi:thiamine biosynthesis lipoprotein